MIICLNVKTGDVVGKVDRLHFHYIGHLYIRITRWNHWHWTCYKCTRRTAGSSKEAKEITGCSTHSMLLEVFFIGFLLTKK
jgi:hypothetical protein